MALNRIARTKRVRLVCIGLSASALAAMAIQVTLTATAEAKTPGSTYCYHGTCHRVKTLEETQALVGVEESITASHYDDCSRDRYNPCGLTSSGERFHPDRPDNTASPIYPDGTTLLVWSPATGHALVVRVNNAGPYWGDRTLDLSRAAAEKLGFEGEGVASLRVRVIKAPDPAEAKYVENRDYPPVPGDIGQYANLEDAQRGMAVVLAFQASAGSPFAPVTTANAFAGHGIGSEMLVAEAPQALGRSLTTVAYTTNDANMASLAFGGFTMQSHPATAPQSRGEVALLGAEAHQTTWDEDRVIDPTPEPVTESSAVATADAKEAAKEQVRQDQAAKAKAPEERVAAANDDDSTPRQKRVARDRDDDDKAEARARSRKSVARNEERSRSSRVARADRNSEHPRVAYSEERSMRPTSASYASGQGDGARSAQQTTSDNLRPL
jgi:rare lipoprotein A (peptidoglycan hydrolase)